MTWGSTIIGFTSLWLHNADYLMTWGSMIIGFTSSWLHNADYLITGHMWGRSRMTDRSCSTATRWSQFERNIYHDSHSLLYQHSDNLFDFIWFELLIITSTILSIMASSYHHNLIRVISWQSTSLLFYSTSLSSLSNQGYKLAIGSAQGATCVDGVWSPSEIPVCLPGSENYDFGDNFDDD